MTELLYQNNSYLARFSARVTGCTPAKTPGQWLVTLNATAFYPTGGGQSADFGTLGGAAVLDVHEQDGEVFHLTDAPLCPGGKVTGEIDWPRRFDHMQQHSGEHIVSGLLHAAVGAANVGFHLGSEIVTIDLDKPVTPALLSEIEISANEVVFADRPVRLSYPSRSELASIDYRSKKPIDGQVRLVEFPGADLCACCGTHVAHTGEVGLIKFCSMQNYKGGVRIGMVSGKRAVALSMQEHAQVAEISALLCAPQPKIVPAVRAQAQALSAAKARANEAVTALLAQKAAGFAGQSTALCFETGLDPDQTRRFALAICESGCAQAAVFCGDDETGYRYTLAGSSEPDTTALHARMKAGLCCRGGGKDGLFQGSTTALAQAVRQFFEKA